MKNFTFDTLNKVSSIKAKIIPDDTDGNRSFLHVEMTNIELYGFNHREVILKGEFEGVVYFCGFNLLMLTFLVNPSDIDSCASQNQLWTLKPLLMRG